MDDPGIEDDAPSTLVAPLAGRLDKALAAATDAFSRSRLAALVSAGAVRRANGALVTDPGLKVKPGEAFLLTPPPPAPADPEPEPIPLSVAFEDAEVIVVDKPAGMVVHPAPGAERGTLVAALLHHCGASLSGVGGVARPGIVHRIDKDTSGLLVVAKTDAAHAALSAQFAAHAVERRYLALVEGVPDRADPRLAGLPAVRFEGPTLVIDAPIARHRSDRKKMAVVAGGRRAVTRARVLERLPGATLLACELETGRTHQIRVHLAHVGHPLVGDPVYGRARPGPGAAFPRQALHAATLGFRHPADGRHVRFESPTPPDMADLLAAYREIGPTSP
ncbi:MAG: RluA family pseudouridine synthase [Rhodobacteraceae bacterium]|nr:MAG: RluA family pseudouridine synthase [Paracoccaceae bacterium]